MVNEHLDPPLLARIVDLGHDSASPDQLRHLAGCRSCLEAFHDVALIRGIDLASADADIAAPTPVVSAAPSFFTSGRRILGAASLAVIALAFVLMALPDSPAVPIAPESVLSHLASQSETGFVVDETADRPYVPSATVRSGGNDPEPGDVLANDPGRIHGTMLTMLSRGQLEEARSLLDSQPQDLRREPWARRLEALMAYRASDLDQAEQILRELLENDDGDDVARFNLAVLLDETGRTDEARTQLDGVAAPEGSILHHRADTLADTLR